MGKRDKAADAWLAWVNVWEAWRKGEVSHEDEQTAFEAYDDARRKRDKT